MTQSQHKVSHIDLAKERARRAVRQVEMQRKIESYKPLLFPTEFACPILKRKGKITRFFERQIAKDPDEVKEWSCRFDWKPCAVIYPDLHTKAFCLLERLDEDDFVAIAGK